MWCLWIHVRNCAGHWQVAWFRFRFFFLIQTEISSFVSARRGTCVSVGHSKRHREYGSTVNIHIKVISYSLDCVAIHSALHVCSKILWILCALHYRIDGKWRIIIMYHLFGIYHAYICDVTISSSIVSPNVWLTYRVPKIECIEWTSEEGLPFKYVAMYLPPERWNAERTSNRKGKARQTNGIKHIKWRKQKNEWIWAAGAMIEWI